jgi:phosphate-selective porin
MARRRPDVTMAIPLMPVRCISVCSLVIFVTLAAGTAAAAGKDTSKEPAAEVDEEAAPSVKVEAPAADATVESKPAAAPTSDAVAARSSTETVGFSEHAFVRTPGGEVVLFPGGRVQVDGAAFPRQTPKSGFFIRRARVELAGWVGRIFYFDVSAEFAPSPLLDGDPPAPSALPATDNYVALAPFGDVFILQAGEFDVPFTLENRTSDAYTDFIERSMVSRSLGAPRNKEVGAMAHGLVADGLFYYSAGVFNGDGPDYRNFDNQVDAIGRMVVAPLASSQGMFRRLSLGGSGWYGRHTLGPTFPVEATPGGLRFVNPRWTTGQPARTLELRENGTVAAFGGELTVPFGTRFGLRGEGVYKRQQLAEVDPAATPVVAIGSATLTGLAAYGEMWFWLAGDDRMLPAPGFELPLRTEGRYRRAFDDGLMLAVRGEFIKEDLVSDQPTLGDPTRATTRVISGTAGANYWRGSFARISLNYVINMWSGTSETIKALRGQSQFEHELLLRFAMCL